MDANDSDEAFLLDLLNSRPIVDGVEQDELATTASGTRWLAAHGLRTSAAELRAARRARDVLRDVELGHARIESVAGLLGGARAQAVTAEGGLAWRLDPADAGRVGARAALAWDAVVRAHPDRLRPCGNPECQLFLVDHSRAGTARWCSMATCGNRMKARRHHARSRES